jgi:hypothetical protein
VLAFVPLIAVILVVLCPVESRVNFGIIAGAVTAICAAIQACYWLLPSAMNVEDETPPAWHPGAEMTPSLRRLFSVDLDSFNGERRRSAVQTFADSGVSPIAGIRCWPMQECSALQLAAAEAVLREWLDYVEQNPSAPEEVIVAELFPLEEQNEEWNCVKPRVRRLAQPKEQRPSKVVAKLNQWSETVKQKMLDLDLLQQPNEHAESDGEDVQLAPLDREQFAERIRAKVEETMGFVTDSLAAAKTDYDLLLAERSIHPLLSTLRWEAIAAALELRQPDGGPISIDELREAAESIEPADSVAPPAKPTGGWVSKYRRMRAAGI